MICTSGLATVGLFTSTQSYPSPDSTTTTTTTSATAIATTTTQEPSATPHHDITTLDGVLSGSGSTITTINANNHPVCCRCLVRRNSDWSQLTFMCVHPSTPSSSPPVRRRRACETRVAHTLRRVGDEMYLRRMPLSHLVALYLCQVLPGGFGRNTLSRWLCPQQEGRANMEGNEKEMKEMEKEKAEEE